MFHYERIFAPTVAHMAQASDLVVAGEVMSLHLQTVRHAEVAILSVTLREVFKPQPIASEVQLLSLEPISDLAEGSAGIFFLTARARDRRPIVTAGLPDLQDVPWLLEWGDIGIVRYPSADFIAIRDYVRLCCTYDATPVQLALAALRSASPRLRAEAAYGLGRASNLAEALSPDDVDLILRTIEDPDYPDPSRSRLAASLARVPSASSELYQVVSSLIGSDIGDTDFRVQGARILASSAQPAAVDMLMALADSADYRVCSQALAGLGTVGSDQALSKLKQVRDSDADIDIRIVAAEALSSHLPEAALPLSMIDL